jgi:putative glycosyltransferase (TIGR04372 family)
MLYLFQIKKLMNNFRNFIIKKFNNNIFLLKRIGINGFIKIKFYVILNFFLSIPFYIILFFFSLILRILSSFIKVRFQRLLSERIGHYATQVEIYLCEKKLSINQPKFKNIDIFFNLGIVCNKYLYKLIKKKIRIYPEFFINKLLQLNKFFNFFFKNINSSEVNLCDRDLLNLFQRCEIQLMIPDFDQKKGIKILDKMGIEKEKKFVCIAARGDSYLRTRHPNVNWDYHDYRNSSIYNFLDAVRYLNSKGYYVIRIGKNTTEKIKNHNLMLFDYADSNFQDDFMDIFLPFKCSFVISTGFGLDQLPYIYRKKILYVNWSSFNEIYSFSPNIITIFKHYYSEETKKRLSIKEIFEQNLEGIVDNKIFKEKKISLLENSSLEIKELVQEFIESHEKTFLTNQKDIWNQKKFWEIYKYYMIKNNFTKFHLNFDNARIGYNFLRKNEYLLN